MLAATAVLVSSLTAAPAAGGQTATTSGNPLAFGTWGVYKGGADGVYPAYEAATGRQKRLLAKVALQPRVRWFGGWMPRSEVRSKVRDYITETQAGNSQTLIQMAIFRLWPNGESHGNDPLTAEAQAAYRAWVDAAARGIRSARVMMILEPDLGAALKGWRPAVRLRLAKYAAHVFGALPRTTVYIDGGASDWLTVSQAASLLRSAGVGSVRGFALNATHYDSTVANIRHGRQIVAALARTGLPNKHFVINTADTGRPFTWLQYWHAHPNGNFDNAAVCRTKTERRCVTLGIPPTWHVADAAWHLPPRVATQARRWCDAYEWIGRPWLVNQAAPFSLSRTLAIARTTPYKPL